MSTILFNQLREDYIMKVNTKVSVTKNKLTISVPESISVDKLACSYDKHTGLLTLKEDPKGLKLHKTGIRKRVHLSRKLWAKQAPLGKFKSVIEWQNGQATIALSQPIGKVIKRIPKQNRIEIALERINKFAKANKFDIVVEHNTARLEKIQIIK